MEQELTCPVTELRLATAGTVTNIPFTNGEVGKGWDSDECDR